MSGPSRESKLMLGVLNLLAMQGKYRLFEGVDRAGRKQAVKRHAKNRVARQSRRVNRNG